MLEVWQGDGETTGDLFKTVELDRESRKYINIKVKNVVTDPHN